ncbi:peptidase C11, clostripain [Candidatus Paraburkholderia kirkii]|nr:peptidase C11, clostripain [Candidatus Paraburkholderia kirkii]
MITALLAACGGSDSSNNAPPDAKLSAATVMIYLNGSDLESSGNAATTNLKQMLAAKFSDDVNVVITTGGANKADADDPVTDWRTLRRYVLRAGKLELLTDLGKQDMDDPATLTNFIAWAKTAYPAEKYHLLFWDHGGAYRGFGVDEVNGGKGMKLPVLQSAIKSAHDQTGIHFETIGFDACLMAHAEVAYAPMPYASPRNSNRAPDGTTPPCCRRWRSSRSSAARISAGSSRTASWPFRRRTPKPSVPREAPPTRTTS